MTVRDLDKLFKPEAVALIGAMPRHGSLGAMLARNLRRAEVMISLWADPCKSRKTG
jgi:acyl-CoA synthetase (NDP forming)